MNNRKIDEVELAQGSTIRIDERGLTIDGLYPDGTIPPEVDMKHLINGVYYCNTGSPVKRGKKITNKAGWKR